MDPSRITGLDVFKIDSIRSQKAPFLDIHENFPWETATEFGPHSINMVYVCVEQKQNHEFQIHFVKFADLQGWRRKHHSAAVFRIPSDISGPRAAKLLTDIRDEIVSLPESVHAIQVNTVFRVACNRATAEIEDAKLSVRKLGPAVKVLTAESYTGLRARNELRPTYPDGPLVPEHCSADRAYEIGKELRRTLHDMGTGFIVAEATDETRLKKWVATRIAEKEPAITISEEAHAQIAEAFTALAAHRAASGNQMPCEVILPVTEIHATDKNPIPCRLYGPPSHGILDTKELALYAEVVRAIRPVLPYSVERAPTGSSVGEVVPEVSVRWDASKNTVEVSRRLDATRPEIERSGTNESTLPALRALHEDNQEFWQRVRAAVTRDAAAKESFRILVDSTSKGKESIFVEWAGNTQDLDLGDPCYGNGVASAVVAIACHLGSPFDGEREHRRREIDITFDFDKGTVESKFKIIVRRAEDIPLKVNDLAIRETESQKETTALKA